MFASLPGEPPARQAGPHGQRRHLNAEPRIGAKGPDHSRGREGPRACEAGSGQICLPVPKCVVRSVQEGAAQPSIRRLTASRCRKLSVVLSLEDGVQKSSGFLQVVSPGLEAVGLAGRVPSDKDGGFVKLPRNGILARHPVPEFPVDHIAIGRIEPADIRMRGAVRDDRRATERILLPEQLGKIPGRKAQELQARASPRTRLCPRGRRPNQEPGWSARRSLSRDQRASRSESPHAPPARAPG